MKRFATLALLMALAGPAVGAETDPETLKALEAAGGVTMQLAICDGIAVAPEIVDRLKSLEALSRTRPDYWEAYGKGITIAKQLALADPDLFCEVAEKRGA